MQIFAITCLLILIFGTTHLINWMWRNWMWRNTDFEELMPSGFITIIYILVMMSCFYYLTLWLYPLIKP